MPAAPAAADPLAGRFVLGGTLYHAPGESRETLLLPKGFSDSAVPVPEEVAALGFETGARAVYTFTRFFSFAYWPYVAFQGGVPVAAVREADEGMRELPAMLALDSLPRRGTLSYEREGERLALSGSAYDSEKARFEDGTTGFTTLKIDALVSPLSGEGCFDVKVRHALRAYRDGASEPFQSRTERQPQADLEACLEVVESRERPGQGQAHLLRVHLTGVAGLSSGGGEVDQTLYALGFSGEGPATVTGGAYVAASGDLGFFQRQALERANRFAAALEESVLAQNYELAARQIPQLKAHLADLEADGVVWRWRRLPTEAGVERYETLVRATETYRLAFIEAQERLAKVQEQLERLRTGFSANVVKTMLRSTIDWLDVVPSDPLSALADYSDIAGALSLTQTLRAWKENAEEDAGLLVSQVRAIRHFEALERELAARVDEIVAARRALFERIEAIGERRVLDLQAALLAG